MLPTFGQMIIIFLLHMKLILAILVQQDHGYIYNRPPAVDQIKSTFPAATYLPLPQLPNGFTQQIFPGAGLAHNHLLDFLPNADSLYYTNDGRLLKQYEVMERIIGDLRYPDHFIGSSPIFLDSILDKLASQANLPNSFFNFNGKPQQQANIFQPVTRNHGPVALGSGSLGYIRLANGAAYLGSGSLGYISGQDAVQAINDAKTRKPLSPPGPLHFGHGFEN